MTSTTTRPVRTSNRNAGHLIRERVPFAGSNLYADYFDGYVHCGYLPREQEEKLREAARKNDARGRSTYVVHSYGTPIAWVDADDNLVVPDVRYSVSTTRHQSYCRQAVTR